MSGGSHDYICWKIESELCGQMEDDELNDLMIDISKLAHDLEWYHSGDIGQDDYFKTVARFKRKWFGDNRNKRLAKYITDSNSLHTKTILRLLNTVEGESEDGKN